MPSVSMNRLVDNAKVRLPGALESAIYAEMFSVVGELCKKAGVWKQEFDFDVEPVAVDATDIDLFTYRISPPTGSRIHMLIGCANSQSFPVRASLQQPNHIVLASSPNEADTYKAWVTLTVTDPVTRNGDPVIPDWIVDRYNDVILDGVVGRMMSQAAKPYSSLQLAGAHLKAFQAGVSTARIESDRNGVYRRQNWRFPRSYATVRSR